MDGAVKGGNRPVFYHYRRTYVLFVPSLVQDDDELSSGCPGIWRQSNPSLTLGLDPLRIRVGKSSNVVMKGMSRLWTSQWRRLHLGKGPWPRSNGWSSRHSIGAHAYGLCLQLVPVLGPMANGPRLIALPDGHWLRL